MKKLLLFYFLCFSSSLIAQPGWHYVNKNINDYSIYDNHSNTIKVIYVIDSTSDLSKLNNMRSLQRLTIVVNLKALPKEIYLLSDSLREISISYSPNRQPPDLSSLNQLKKLTSIYFDGDVDTLSIRQLKYLTNISFNNYPGKIIPDLHQLERLKSLSVSLGKVKYIGELSKCRSLRELQLYALDSLKSLDFDMSKMNLTTLEIGHCYFLKNISGLSSCKSLKELKLSETEQLKTLNFDVGKTNLKKLTIDYCWYLNDINTISNSKYLNVLNLIGPNSLKSLDFDMSKMNLDSLTISNSDYYYHTSIKNVNGIASCSSLKALSIIGLDSLESLDFNMSKMQLKELLISECKNLKSIQGISTCRSLSELVITDNPQLNKIPDIKNELSFVRTMSIENNRNLKVGTTNIYDRKHNQYWEIFNNATQ